MSSPSKAVDVLGVKERPILFSAPMVLAILDGRKTQTRRAVKRIQWRPGVNPDFSQARPFVNAGEWRIAGSEEMTYGFRCPYGAPGDRLWVRETWGYRCGVGVNPTTEAVIEYQADGARRNCAVPSDQAGLPQPQKGMTRDELERWWKRSRPSIHMPRWACRLVLEVTDVRVERLQTISEADCCAEGCGSPITRDYKKPKFEALWSSINGADSWDANPWVWVINFKRATQ